jgi:hypothetical protein
MTRIRDGSTLLGRGLAWYSARRRHEETMAVPQPRYSAEETARRGDEIYERRVRTQVEAEHRGEVVAIDVESGAYALGDGALAASRRLLARDPEAPIWLVRVGHRALHRIGQSYAEACV